MWRRQLLGQFCILVVLASTFTAPAAGQVIQGQIAGTITDENGGALPGVTVTLTSPALQVPQVVQVSDGVGEYRFPELPPGVYRLNYELAGFGTLVREGIRITTGFAARVDAVLTLAAVAETLTVVGQTPLVDTNNTRGGTTVSQDILTSTPNSMTMQDVYLISGGVTASPPPTNGEGGVRSLTTLFAPVTYGQQTTFAGYQTMDGILTYSNQVPDLAALEEIDVRTFGNTAEVCCPGYASVLIVKSGGNTFQGSVREYYQNDRFQSNNIDDALRAQGITTGRDVQYLNDFSADLGGRIIRDKLWFYGAFHDQRNDAYLPGFSRTPGPDGIWSTTDDVPALALTEQLSRTIKFSYQASQRHKFVGMYHKNEIVENASQAGRFIPFESAIDYSQPFPSTKGEWQGVLGDGLFVSVVGAVASIGAYRDPEPCCAELVSTFDLVTQQQTGAAWNTLKGWRKATRFQTSGTVNYLPKGSFFGSHQLLAGGAAVPEKFEVNLPVAANGDYRLVFSNGAPAQFWTRNTPVEGTAWSNKYFAFVTDSWRPHRRLTVNLGVRWDRYTAYIPEQVKQAGPWPFAQTGQLPRTDVGDWMAIAPRVGAAFDLFGHGKTVLKATYGRYYHDYEYGWVGQFSANYSATTAYRWTDPTGCRCYVPGTVNLDPNGTSVLSITGASNTIVNPDLDLVYTDEVSASVEHELPGGISLRGLYLYKEQQNTQAVVNTLRPYSAYNQVLGRRDPGPDGVLGSGDDGAPLTLYDYDPSFIGSRFVANTLVNATERVDNFQNIELALRKRESRNWFAYSSLLLTKNHKWRVYAVQSPNDEIFPLNRTWMWSYRLSGGYVFPYGVRLSTIYQADNGVQGARTAVFAAPNSGQLTIPVEAPETKGPSRHVVNLRVSKELRFGRHSLSLDMDTFNLFNTNVGWAQNLVSGSRYGYLTDLAQSRVLRFGAVYRF